MFDVVMDWVDERVEDKKLMMKDFREYIMIVDRMLDKSMIEYLISTF